MFQLRMGFNYYTRGTGAHKSQLRKILVGVVGVCTWLLQYHIAEPCPTEEDYVYINMTLSSSTDIYRPGDIATFHCITKNSDIQGWDSTDYIGTGGHYLEVFCLANNQVASRVLANVTHGDCSKNAEMCTVIESQLRIIVQAIPTSLISCININGNNTHTIVFNVSLQPELSTSSNKSKMYPGETVTFMCGTRATRSHTWIIEVIGSNTQSHQITVDESGVVTLKSSTLFDDIDVSVGLVNSFNKNGFIILESELNITILQSMGYEVVSVTCQNDGLGNDTTITLQVGAHEGHYGVTANDTNTTGSQGVVPSSHIGTVILMLLVAMLVQCHGRWHHWH